jgi:hypothetical protein
MVRTLFLFVQCITESCTYFCKSGTNGFQSLRANCSFAPLGLVVFRSSTQGLRPFGKLRAGSGLYSDAASRLESKYLVPTVSRESEFARRLFHPVRPRARARMLAGRLTADGGLC